MVAKIKICTLLFFLLILGCTDIKEEKIEYKFETCSKTKRRLNTLLKDETLNKNPELKEQFKNSLPNY